MSNNGELYERLIEYLKGDMDTYKSLVSETTTTVAVLQEGLKDVKKQVKGNTTLTQEGLAKIHKRIDDHMENEEEEQKATTRKMESISTRLGNIEDIFKFLKWLAPIGMIVWPLLIPFLQGFVLRLLLPENIVLDLLSFYPW